MKPIILPLPDPQANLETVGGKGTSLAKLIDAGLPVPGGFHVTTEAYRLFVSSNNLQPGIDASLKNIDLARPTTLERVSQEIYQLFSEAQIPDELGTAITRAYQSLADPAQLSAIVAVRSSATAEDLPGASFAGQQETFLNVHGVARVLAAVKDCWASLWTARAIAYRAHKNILSEGVALGVVVQMLVKADAAGIMFTINPLNAQRDQLVINAAWGLGEAVVSGAVTPDIITIDKLSGRVLERETSEKLVMTVCNESGTCERPVPESMRNESVLSDAKAVELANIGIKIEELYGRPMDIEFTLTNGDIAIVQARPVTTESESSVEWAKPDPKGIYMRGSVVDLMPKPLSPLFISWGIESMKKQMDKVAQKITRAKPYLVDDYLTTINSYGYMNGYMPPKMMWWVITGMMPFMLGIFRKMLPLWRDVLRPNYRGSIAELDQMNPSEMTVNQLWSTSQSIFDEAAYYICSLMFATLGASAGSERLLTTVYDKFAKREGDPDGVVLVMGWNNTPIRAEKSLYDLAQWMQKNERLSKYFLETPTDELINHIPQPQIFRVDTAIVENPQVSGWEEFVSKFHYHLSQYGHIVYQLDFVEALPMECPRILLENIKLYLRGEGANPYERQQASERLRIKTTDTMLDRLRGFKRWAFRFALNWGQGMAEVREDALSDIGLAYPVLRRLLLELGERFVKMGAIRQENDIFFLQKGEIDTLIEGKISQLDNQVHERRVFLKRMEKEIPPPMIPIKERIMGVKVDVFVAHSAETQMGNTMKGVPASSGKATATACILLGPEDFDQMHPGDILVASTTTPAWTPLFAMASAVVTDIGGPLSHGSIVAREYGIPAVMGTGVATKRIQNGQLISVDGSAGIVTLL